MGILGLSRLIADVAPEAIKEVELGSLFGRRIAIDASMSIYQFLIAIRNRDQLMTNESGETTSHLIGLFYRTIKLLETGIKPIYVFDGKAPQLKGGELTKRLERRQEAEAKLAEAKEEQDMENISKFNKRVVRVTRQHNEDCKKLLRLLGLPVIESPSEAEAQCAQLCKEGLVYATATEDMDALSFGSPRLIRHLTSGKEEKVKEYYLDKVLSGLGLNSAQFIDLGILMGCDYCHSIRGIGGKKGLDLIRKFGSIETILEKNYGITEFVEVDIDYGDRRDKDSQTNESQIVENDNENVSEVNDSQTIDNTQNDTQTDDTVVDQTESQNSEEIDDTIETIESDDNESQQVIDSPDGKSSAKKKKSNKDKKSVIPENWLFLGARKLFEEPNVLKGTIQESDLKQKDMDEEAIVEYLCIQNGFSEDRVRNALKRVKEAKGKCSQTRIDSFFKSMPANNAKLNDKLSNKKDKRATPASKTPNKRGRRK